MDAIPPLTDRFFPTFCAKLRCLGAPRVPSDALLLSLEGEDFPLLGASLRCRFAAFRALLRRLGALRSLGLAFRFLLQRTLARGFPIVGRHDVSRSMRVEPHHG
jgi:hypothetical protein